MVGPSGPAQIFAVCFLLSGWCAASPASAVGEGQRLPLLSCPALLVSCPARPFSCVALPGPSGVLSCPALLGSHFSSAYGGLGEGGLYRGLQGSIQAAGRRPHDVTTKARSSRPRPLTFFTHFATHFTTRCARTMRCCHRYGAEVRTSLVDEADTERDLLFLDAPETPMLLTRCVAVGGAMHQSHVCVRRHRARCASVACGSAAAASPPWVGS